MVAALAKKFFSDLGSLQRFMLTLLFCSGAFLFNTQEANAADVEVNVIVDQDRAVENQPIKGIITIGRDEKEKVDAKGFRCDGKELEVQFLHDAVESSLSIINGVRHEYRRIISTYQFVLPKRKAGRYVLPPVSMIVGGRAYQSRQTPFLVVGTQKSSAFTLEAFVTGGNPIYPGQRVVFTYRLSCRKQIEATADNTPLLEAAQFRRIGEKRINYDVRDGVAIQEISQEVQAISAGEYQFPSSSIEGVPYQKDFFGNRIYEKTRLRAEAPPLTVVVEPFPEKGKPLLFQGALGRFKMDVRLMSSNEMSVGDKIKLMIVISGEGEWSTVHAPPLAQQAAFTMDFRLNDLPPVGESSEVSKKFFVEMRPLSATITQIPPMEYAFFDPVRKEYYTLRSQAISLKIKPTSVAAHSIDHQTQELFQQHVETEKSHQTEEGGWRAAWDRPLFSEVRGAYPLAKEELQTPRTTLKLLWLLPIASLLLWVQRILQKRSGRSSLRSRSSSALLLQQLEKAQDDLQLFHGIETLLLEALIERGIIERKNDPEELPSVGIAGRVKEFLLQMQEQRFASGQTVDSSALIEKAKMLYQEIHRG